MHKITNLLVIELNLSLKLRDNNERKNTLVTEVVCFQMLDSETSKCISEVSESNSFFLKNYITSGSRFPQCFILRVSTALQCSLPIKVLCFWHHTDFDLGAIQIMFD